jgi:hypothetical protein
VTAAGAEATFCFFFEGDDGTEGTSAESVTLAGEEGALAALVTLFLFAAPAGTTLAIATMENKKFTIVRPPRPQNKNKN